MLICKANVFNIFVILHPKVAGSKVMKNNKDSGKGHLRIKLLTAEGAWGRDMFKASESKSKTD